MKEIPLTHGYVVIVDDDKYDELNKYKWYAAVHKRKDGTIYTVYASRSVKAFGKNNVILMHRQLLDFPKSMHIDHIDSNGLNNAFSNLRICTAKNNLTNRRPNKNSASAFKGVTWDKKNSKWISEIYPNGKHVHLGLFTSELDAARAYNAAALKYFGEFARINTYDEA